MNPQGRKLAPMDVNAASAAPLMTDLPLAPLVKKYLPTLGLTPLSQKAIPRLAKDRKALSAVARAVREIPTQHALSGSATRQGYR